MFIAGGRDSHVTRCLETLTGPWRVVVGIGVVVVVQAQRGMLDTDAAVDTEGALREADDGADGQLADLNDSGEPPVQGEPDLAGDDETEAPRASNKSRSAVRQRPTSEPSDDEEVGTGIRKTAAIDSDPFDVADEPAAETDNAPPTAGARASSTAKKSAIDIVDIDEVEDLEAPADHEKEGVAVAKKAIPARGRGPVLTLDEPDEDLDQKPARHADEPAKAGAGPRLLSASDDGPREAMPTQGSKTDPLGDDDADLGSADEPPPAPSRRPRSRRRGGPPLATSCLSMTTRRSTCPPIREIDRPNWDRQSSPTSLTIRNRIPSKAVRIPDAIVKPIRPRAARASQPTARRATSTNHNPLTKLRESGRLCRSGNSRK